CRVTPVWESSSFLDTKETPVANFPATSSLLTLLSQAPSSTSKSTMVEYGVNVNNKFLYAGDSDEELEDPSVLLQKAEVKKDDKTPAQKKAEKKAEKLKKEKAAAAAKEAEAKAAAAAAAKPAAGKENARPDGRGRGRGGPRGAGGDRRPPRENTEGGEQRTFSGEGRGRGGPRGRGGRGAFRGGRGGNTSGGEETREVAVDETPKDGEVQQSGERPAFSGRGGRGRGGAFRDGDRPAGRGGAFRDGDRPAGRGGRGRFGDRQSGSDRTGVKSVDSKGGHGKSNWGSNKDEIEAGTENTEVEKSEEEAPVEPQPPREKTAEEIAFEEEEARIAAQKTLTEFRAAQKKEEQKFNLRQAGEGADEKNFGKLVPLQKERFEDETTEEEVVEIVKKEPRNKQIIVDFKFNEPNRGEFGGRGRGGDRGRRGGDRGGRGARTGRGGAASGSGSARYNEPFRVAEDAFPAL
ncbi:hypothetical protein PFISCL1PPCAC_4018, partial [Pristionchus fissidentatus]